MNIYIIFAAISLASLAVLMLPIYGAKDIKKSTKHYFSGSVVALFLLAGGFLYHQFGAADILPLIKEREARIAELKQVIRENSELIKQNPKNLKPWVVLGDSFIETGQYTAAKNAFKQSVLLSGGNPVLIMAYSRAIIAEADGKVTDEAKKSIDMVLLLAPENEEARYFSAVRKLQTGDTQNAMKEMKALYKSLPDDSPVKEMINRQIGRGN